MRAFLGLIIWGILGSACTALPEIEHPVEYLDLGPYVVTSFQLPLNNHGAMPWAQRMVGKTFVFGPDRIAFPAEFGRPDCQHQGYRLNERTTVYLPPFDLGEAGTYSVLDAGITDKVLLEVWNFCIAGVYLSADRGKMYMPGRGALLILDKN